MVFLLGLAKLASRDTEKSMVTVHMRCGAFLTGRERRERGNASLAAPPGMNHLPRGLLTMVGQPRETRRKENAPYLDTRSSFCMQRKEFPLHGGHLSKCAYAMRLLLSVRCITRKKRPLEVMTRRLSKVVPGLFGFPRYGIVCRLTPFTSHFPLLVLAQGYSIPGRS
jgi:hypothetical protein